MQFLLLLTVFSTLVVGCGAPDAVSPLDLATQDTCVYPAHFVDRIEHEVEFSSLETLPPEIQKKLHAYLATRLGSSFPPQLRFREAAFVNPAAVPDVVRSERELGREYVAYVVLFTVVLSEGQEYCTGVHLGIDGRVVQGIGLPDLVATPQKSTVLRESAAVEAAARLGLSRSSASPRLSYNPKIDSLVWEISEPTGHEGNRAVIRTCYINAHTGAFLGWSQGEILFN
jgi:hypothetical protein